MVYYVKIQKYVIWRNHMILACQNISKAFGTTEIIKNASFHIEEREKAALIGNNGAGKTTLTRVITGDMLPTSGTGRHQRCRKIDAVKNHHRRNEGR